MNGTLEKEVRGKTKKPKAKRTQPDFKLRGNLQFEIYNLKSKMEEKK